MPFLWVLDHLKLLNEVWRDLESGPASVHVSRPVRVVALDTGRHGHSRDRAWRGSLGVPQRGYPRSRKN